MKLEFSPNDLKGLLLLDDDFVFCNLFMFMCCLGCWSLEDCRGVSETSRPTYVPSVFYGFAE